MASERTVGLCGEPGRVLVCNSNSLEQTDFLQAGQGPFELAVSSDGDLLAAADSSAGELHVWNLVTLAQWTVPVGMTPMSVHWLRDTHVCFVLLTGANHVLRIPFGVSGPEAARYAGRFGICARDGLLGTGPLKAVLQRVSGASVAIDGVTVSQIGRGLVILLGVESKDTIAEMEWGARKAAELRIFEDAERKMNRSLFDVHGEALVVSQFTLLADVQKGRRPSFINAAPPEMAEPLYEQFVDTLRTLGVRTATGVFAAKMAVTLVNEGPVTILLER